MQQSKNQLILGLSVSAVVLFAVLVVLSAFPQARATVSVSSGDYAAAAGQVSKSKDAVYVVDMPTGRMLVYRYDRNQRRIEKVDGRDLAKELSGSSD